MDDYLTTYDIQTDKEDTEAVFTAWLKESQTYHDYLLQFQKISYEYYIGNQTMMREIPAGDTNTVENRVFEAIETLVPIVTANPHNFIVLPASEDEKSVQRANLLQKVLSRKYETLEMQKKLEAATRHMLLYRFGAMKWEWSQEKDDIDVRVIDPRLILIPRMRLDPHDLPYKIEIQSFSHEEMEEYFPDFDLDLISPEENIDVGQTQNDSSPKKLYRVYETWTSDTVAWFSSNKLIEKKPNPYFDFKGREKLTRKDFFSEILKKDKKPTKELIFDNIFDRPTDPFVFFTDFAIGDEPIASVSLTEIAIPIQDAINVQKRQIIDNLRRMGNGQIYVDSDAMSLELAENITNEVGLLIYGEGVASQNKVRREPGTQLPSAHFSNLQHSESVFDNIFGIHAATRGAAGSKTLGQDIISRQQDFTRADLVTRVLNRGVSRLAVGLVQLMKMFYTETQVIKILGEEGTVEFLRLNRDDIEKQIEIIVTSGETLPMDKVSLRTEAVQLWQLGALDPVTLAERLEIPNPEKYAERLVAWKQGQLTAETQAKIAQIAAQSKFSSEQGPTNTETPTGETGRGVETPANVVQRSTAGIGGTAPSLPGAPNL